MKTLKNCVNDESGATATEYVILVALIAIALIAVVKAFGGKIADIFNDITTKLGNDVEGAEYKPPEG